MQHTATHCNTLQHKRMRKTCTTFSSFTHTLLFLLHHLRRYGCSTALQCVVMCCRVWHTLQQNATDCNRLQHTPSSSCRTTRKGSRATARQARRDSGESCKCVIHTKRHCNRLLESKVERGDGRLLQKACNTLKQTAIHCNRLQYTVTDCKTRHPDYSRTELSERAAGLSRRPSLVLVDGDVKAWPGSVL